MIDKRIELHNLLLKIFNNKNVYYQPPENLKMAYPCIRYVKNDFISSHADDIKYINRTNYLITIIDKKPDNEVIDKILELPLTSFNRHYVSNNLNHDVISIYF